MSSQYGREGGGLLRGALPLRAPAPRQLLREACPLRLRLRRLRVRRARVWAERARLWTGWALELFEAGADLLLELLEGADAAALVLERRLHLVRGVGRGVSD